MAVMATPDVNASQIVCSQIKRVQRTAGKTATLPAFSLMRYQYRPKIARIIVKRY
jgi:hypothetical protein